MRAPALVCLQAFPAARLTHTPAPTYQEPRQALRTHQGRSRSRSSLFDQLLYTYVLGLLRALPYFIHPCKHFLEVHLFLRGNNFRGKLSSSGDPDPFAARRPLHQFRQLLLGLKQSHSPHGPSPEQPSLPLLQKLPGECTNNSHSGTEHPSYGARLGLLVCSVFSL